MTKTILGFDVSSTTIGWCVLELDESTNKITFIKAGTLKPTKKGTMVERIVDTRSKVETIIKDNKPDDIAIEELIKFMPKSTATTVVVLSVFNMMTCVAAHDYLSKVPNIYNVLSIRHGLKISKDCPKKEDMPELVANHLEITFPYEYNKKGMIKEESLDKADGVAAALYHAFVLTGKAKHKGKKK
jgi:Holliday junction resolvasome RuvABC endonuclease subunit